MTDSARRSWNDIIIPAPGTYLLDQAHRRIGFVARHMMVSSVRGEFREAVARIVVDEDPLRSSVSATIRAASINTGNAERDAHLSSPDFFDVETYPTLEYVSTGIKWQANSDPIFFGTIDWGEGAKPPTRHRNPCARPHGLCLAGS
jgi:polyisoprenoid-binding protein YceI